MNAMFMLACALSLLAGSNESSSQAASVAAPVANEGGFLRAQVGLESFSVPFLVLGGAARADKIGVGHSVGVAGGFRIKPVRLGVEFVRTELAQSTAWYKFMVDLEVPIPVSIVEFVPRFAGGYTFLPADGRILHGASAVLGLAIDVRPVRWFAFGLGADFTGQLFRVPQAIGVSLGLAAFGRFSFLL